MSELCIHDLHASLTEDSSQIGTFIAIVREYYSFALYLGKEKYCLLLEKRSGKGVNGKNFETLRKASNLTRQSLLSLELSDVYDLKDELEEKCKMGYFMHSINLFETSKNNRNMAEFLENMQHNLTFMNSFENGDIIKFERALYSHHAVLTDDSRMMVVHRYGEPERPGSFLQSLFSVSGIPSPKAKVAKDFLVEVAGYRRVFNGNQDYDGKKPPRSKEEIVQIAESKIGEEGYSLSTYNCQHFSSYCRNGTHHSPEVENVVKGAFYTSLLGLGAIAGTLALSALMSSKDKEKEKEKEPKNYYS